MDKVIPVRVAVRIRPLSEKEEEEGCQSVVKTVPGRPQVNIASMERAFTFDYAYGKDSAQSSIYDDAVSQMIDKLFEGYNATVLAYGQTGSGKTYSMGTTFDNEKTPEDQAGVIPRSVKEIFQTMGQKSDEVEVSVRVSFVELYREQLFDLLSSKSNRKEDCICELREDPIRGVVIPNLTLVEVNSLNETMEELKKGSLKRVTAATAMNNVSSRSHAIFSLHLTMMAKSEDNIVENSTVSKFHLVDLAGSERAKKTKATGERYKEGVAINQGLLALGNVIAALGEDNPQHIPYRNSKLTRLLQDSLGGNSYTLMISCVSPADSNVEETLSTLRYSDRARKIKNKPIVNMDGNDKEIIRLRTELQTLKLELLQNGGSGSGILNKFDNEEFKRLSENNKRFKEENKELTNALMSCQQELAHLNEKMFLTEGSNEKMKTKLKELIAEIVEKKDNFSFMDVKSRVCNLLNLQNEAEKTIVEHDFSRADISTLSNDGNDDNNDNEEYLEHAKKQSALSNQLSNLNKMLAQKERLASAMCANDEKFQEMRLTYEKSLEALEKEMQAIQKEKEELAAQQHRNANIAHNEASTKIAEQRRKRIQELEAKLQEMKRKMLEQQKAIKMNEKNAAQVKKLADEILQMKQTRVKLVKQMKEDAEKLRVFKQEKEKEVIKLKQNERKQQVKIAKMETLHSKQQSVLRRKMEEAINVNKRLKDVLEKQKNSRTALGKGLAGAGERVRNWINEEMDVVVSVKEAVQSKEQLLTDRKMLTKELNNIKKEMRDTMSKEDRDEHKQKLESLQSDLDLRNAQILQLQKQISDLEQDTNSNSKGRFDNVKSMMEAKIALEHLFEKSVEQTLCNAQTKSEFEELKQLYDEAIKNTNYLEDEIATIKNEYQTNNLKLSRDHEEKVLFLLSKLQNSTENERLKIHEDEIRKYSKLNEELIRMGEENEKLRDQMLQSEGKARNLASNQQQQQQNNNNKKQKKRTSENERYTMDELSEFEEDSNYEDDDDPDWHKTPLFKRIKKLRQNCGNNENGLKKRKLNANDSSAEDESDETPPPNKRFSGNTSKGGCRCKTGCKSNRCQCKKNNSICGDTCVCKSCQNREDSQGEEGRDTLGEVTNNDTANTASLLNDTYTTSVLGKSHLEVPSKSAMKRKTFFKLPYQEGEEGDNDYTSPGHKPLNGTYFKSPILEDDEKHSTKSIRL